MNDELLQRVEHLAQAGGRLFLATAATDGTPHLATASELKFTSGEQLRVTAWFCPVTMENLLQNRRVALVVLSPEGDEGFQVLADVTAVEDLAMMDGFAPEVEAGAQFPQVERALLMEVDRVLAFQDAPHNDEALAT